MGGFDKGKIGGGKRGGRDTGFIGLENDVVMFDVGAEPNKLLKSSIADGAVGADLGFASDIPGFDVTVLGRGGGAKGGGESAGGGGTSASFG